MAQAEAPEPMEFDVSRKLADPVGDMLGAELAAARDGWSLVRLQVEERHLNSFGFVNGTVGFALCDIGMGSAIAIRSLRHRHGFGHRDGDAEAQDLLGDGGD